MMASDSFGSQEADSSLSCRVSYPGGRRKLNTWELRSQCQQARTDCAIKYDAHRRLISDFRGSHFSKGAVSVQSGKNQVFRAASHRAPSRFASSFSRKGTFRSVGGTALVPSLAGSVSANRRRSTLSGATHISVGFRGSGMAARGCSSSADAPTVLRGKIRWHPEIKDVSPGSGRAPLVLAAEPALRLNPLLGDPGIYSGI